MDPEALNRHDVSIAVSVFVVKPRPKFCSLQVGVFRRAGSEHERIKPCYNPGIVRNGNSKDEDRGKLFRLGLYHVLCSGITPAITGLPRVTLSSESGQSATPVHCIVMPPLPSSAIVPQYIGHCHAGRPLEDA